MNAAKVANPVLVVSYYISTGRLNAMYTLRACRHFEGPPRAGDQMLMHLTDSYICNLAAAGNEELAEEKAHAYVDALRARIGEQSGIRHEFTGDFDASAYKRRGKLSARESRQLDTIERGVFPFGKHADKLIVDAPESYILYFADKVGDIGETDVVMLAIANACLGVALDRGYIAKRDTARAEIAAKRADEAAKSNYVGTVGTRVQLHPTIDAVIECPGNQWGPTYLTKMRVGDNMLTYFGARPLGKRGDLISLTATIKSHEEYKGARQTTLARPSKVSVVAEAPEVPRAQS